MQMTKSVCEARVLYSTATLPPRYPRDRILITSEYPRPPDTSTSIEAHVRAHFLLTRNLVHSSPIRDCFLPSSPQRSHATTTSPATAPLR